jgi:hypothetical protein
LLVKIQPNTTNSNKEISIARMRTWMGVWKEIGINVARDNPKTIVVTTRANKPPPMAHRTQLRCALDASTPNQIAVAIAKTQGAIIIFMFSIVRLSFSIYEEGRPRQGDCKELTTGLAAEQS